ncbi:MAG: hypothetical protein WA081_10330 [Desulfosalsimonadaceae bacterium]
MDFGDIFFIAVFIIIIVSNVYKQMKKARLNTSGGQAPVKKSGWKTALELVLEEARKQMENQAKQEPAEAMAGRPTGWEGILQSAPDVNPSEESAQPEKIKLEKPKPEKAREARRQTAVSRETVADQVVFETACMRCGKPMKPIKDQGSGRQSGIVFCEACGEQHRYQMVHGDMKLSRAGISRNQSRLQEKQSRAAERTPLKERPVKPEPAAVEKKDYYAVAADKKIPQKLSQEALRTAVVWAEILAPPVGLRDM